MTAAQFFPQFVLYLGVGQARSSLACDQVLPTGVRPIFQIVIERYPLLGFSTLSVFLNLHAPGCGAKHGQVPGIHAMDTLVVRPTTKQPPAEAGGF